MYMYSDALTCSSSSSSDTMTPAITNMYPTMVAVRGELKKLEKKNPRTTCA